MRDWRKAIEAEGLALDSEQAGAVAGRLGALEKRMLALIGTLDPKDEPAPVFEPAEPSK